MTAAQLKKELLKLEAPLLVEIILTAINRNTPFKNAIIEQLSTKMTEVGIKSANTDNINDAVLEGYWKEMKKIVAKSNREGWESSAERNKFEKYYVKIEEFMAEKDCSTLTKRKITDEMLEQRQISNSGFMNEIEEILLLLCKNEADFAYLVESYENMAKKSEGYLKRIFNDLALDIKQKHLLTEEEYIAAISKNPSKAEHYLAIGLYTIDKLKSPEKGLATLYKGLEQQFHDVSIIVDYLYDYYIVHKDETGLRKLFLTEFHSHAVKYDLLDNLYSYYKTQGNYNAMKEVVLKIIPLSRHKIAIWYENARKDLAPKDFELQYPTFLKILKEYDKVKAIEVMVENKETTELLPLYKQLVEGLLNGNSFLLGTTWGREHEVLLAVNQKLFPLYPTEIYEKLIYIIHRYVRLAERRHYKTAVNYINTGIVLLEKSPKLFEKFRTNIQNISKENANKPALQEEFRSIEWKNT